MHLLGVAWLMIGVLWTFQGHHALAAGALVGGAVFIAAGTIVRAIRESRPT